jgi:hypothetical protein
MLTRSSSRIRKLVPALLLAALALPASALGQATRTWVSGVGDDANPCSRTAPCKTFPGAISRTAAGGEIDVLDPGGFGGVTITKAITIDGENTQAGVLVSGTNAIIVNAGVNDKVVLKGLNIDGVGTGLDGIRFLAGKRLRVQNSKIYNFTGDGIDDLSSTAGNRMILQGVRIHDNGGNGVFVDPPSGVLSIATLRNVQADDNNCGVVAASSGVGGSCGVGASGGGRPTVGVFHSAFTDNALTGVFSNGSLAKIQVSDNEVTNNANGLLAQDSGQIVSWKNNFVASNANDGAATSFATPLKKQKHKRHHNR